MIIKREFVPFWKLKQTDKEAGKIFDKAFSESYLGISKEGKECQYQNLMGLCLYQREMDWAFYKLLDVIKGFERLDEEKPYDNGFGYEDVNKVEVASRDENGITLHLINKYYEVEQIVKVVEIND